jgi:hypothetical protein
MDIGKVFQDVGEIPDGKVVHGGAPNRQRIGCRAIV